MSLRILDKIMEQPDDRPSTVGFVNREIARGAFSFQDVSFQYPGSDYPVINKLSFTVAPASGSASSAASAPARRRSDACSTVCLRRRVAAC
jgi:ABC-type transport system involved in cytochrome bd biosynthesis fused ATPase/permease subunit